MPTIGPIKNLILILINLFFKASLVAEIWSGSPTKATFFFEILGRLKIEF